MVVGPEESLRGGVARGGCGADPPELAPGPLWVALVRRHAAARGSRQRVPLWRGAVPRPVPGGRLVRRAAGLAAVARGAPGPVAQPQGEPRVRHRVLGLLSARGTQRPPRRSGGAPTPRVPAGARS